MSAQKVQIQFSDDQTGKNVNLQVNPNGNSRELAKLLDDTSIESEGFLTSVQLLEHRQGVTLVVKKNNKVIAEAKGDGDNYANFERTSIKQLTIEVTRAS
ncbi:hypothetical protein LTR37_011423 [Vermiconidia calcicola]|uniref:Uncharacterized protein n=1 Tax=Vermiconidia calcicola TaxID=1690605 RepID=A0ACC3N2F4_9PEZI|nr:hypothetical protein LTR37_011423 [Vermiconidia calcicola]